MWLNVWEKWANERKFNPKLEEYEHKDLDKKLQMLYAEVRSKDGLEYEPESLKFMLRAANVEKQSIIQVTGRENEKSLNDYDEGSERVRRELSHIFSGTPQTTTSNSFLGFPVWSFPTSTEQIQRASCQPLCQPRSQGLSCYRPLERARRDGGETGSPRSLQGAVR